MSTDGASMVHPGAGSAGAKPSAHGRRRGPDTKAGEGGAAASGSRWAKGSRAVTMAGVLLGLARKDQSKRFERLC